MTDLSSLPVLSLPSPLPWQPTQYQSRSTIKGRYYAIDGRGLDLGRNLVLATVKEGRTGKVLRPALFFHHPVEDFYELLGEVRRGQGRRPENTPWKVVIYDHHSRSESLGRTHIRSYMEAWFASEQHAAKFLAVAGPEFLA